LFGKRQTRTSLFQVLREDRAGIRVLSLCSGTVQSHPIAEVAALIGRPDTVVRVDIPECSDEAVDLLTDVLNCHHSRFVTACNVIACLVSGFIRINSC
jgi:hypothetical protein